MNLKDTRIVNKIKKGDISTFESLFHEYYPGMCSYAESLVAKPDIAEEVVQDVFFNIWKNKNNFKIVVSLKTYLFRSVFNNSMLYLRKRKRERTLNENWTEFQPVQSNEISEEMEAREMKALISYTLHSLPERTQEIFRLSRFEGLKYKEIAEKLSISVKTVEANMGKALKALKISIEEYRNTA